LTFSEVENQDAVTLKERVEYTVMSRRTDSDSDTEEGLTRSGRVFRQHPAKIFSNILKTNYQQLAQDEGHLSTEATEAEQSDEEYSDFARAEEGRTEEPRQEKPETSGSTQTVEVSTAVPV